MTVNQQSIGTSTDSEEISEKPRLLLIRSSQNNIPEIVRAEHKLPQFIRSHLNEQVKCLSMFFDVTVIKEDCDYIQICNKYKPDITLVDSGLFGGPRGVANTFAFPEIPKLGLLHADADCSSRSVFLSDMEHWGIETYFTISVSMAEYVPAIADNLFVWPNFVDPDIFHDYCETKIVPVLITGSHATHYPWRNHISSIIAEHFPTLNCPHFGVFEAHKTSRMLYGEQYARMINASYMVPTCGTVTKEVVRKHFEIPACKSCLITEKTPALEAAGFVDMQNCVFVTESDVLDKVEYLFKNRDILDTITQTGFRLVQSSHTLRQRNQILQWLNLYKSLLPGQRIIQTGPFGSLTIVDERSGLTNSHTFSNGVDRELLRKANRALLHGNFDEAERNYLSCLNYHRGVAEPMLGLTLCYLYMGDTCKALHWITLAITNCIEIFKASDPDPVQWAYFIISLLCSGKIDEATRRARQFPNLRHGELERCRSVIGALNGSTCGLPEQNDEEGGAKWRRSVHVLPDRDMTSWVKELCTMLRACHQNELAEKLGKMLCAGPASTASPSSHRKTDQITDFAGLTESRAVLPLTGESFRARLRRRVPPRFRPLVVAVLSRMKRNALVKLLMPRDEFALAVQAWARNGRANNALILGASHRSAYTRAFLEGIELNPSMPTVFCLRSQKKLSNKLEKRFARNGRIKLNSSSVKDAKIEADVNAFDIVLIDRDVSCAEEAILAFQGTKTVLVSNINTHTGHEIVCKLLSDREFRMVGGNPSYVAPFAIFTRRYRGELGSNDRTGTTIVDI